MKLVLLAVLALAASAAAQDCRGRNFTSVDTTFSGEGTPFFATINANSELVIYAWNHATALQTQIRFLGAGAACGYDSDTDNTGSAWTATPVDATTGVDACVVYQFTHPLTSSLAQCGWTGASGVFSNEITYTVITSAGGVFGSNVNRTDVTRVPLSIIFPTSANLEAGPVSVFPGPITLAAITDQTFNSTTDVVTVKAAVSLQHPFKVNPNEAITDSDDTGDWDITAAVVTNDAACNDNSGATVCRQDITFTVTPSPGVCVLAGTYTIVVPITCDSTFTGACDAPAPGTATFEFTLSSDNYCPRVVEIATVTAAMKIFTTSGERDSDAAEVLDFSSGSVVYGAVDFSVEAGLNIADVKVLYAEIRSFCTNCVNNVAVLVDRSGATNFGEVSGTVWNGILPPSVDPVDADPNRYFFDFTLNSESVTFDNNDQSGNVPIQISIDFLVNYTAAAGQKAEPKRVRALASTDPAAVGARAQANVRPAAASTSSEATVLGVSQGTVIAAGVSFVALLAVVVAASVVVSRRRAAKAAAFAKVQSSSSHDLQLDSRPQAAAQAPRVGTNDLRTVQSAYDASAQA